MLKRGEVDVAYMLDAPQALELQRDPSLRLAFSGGIGIATIDFLDRGDPKSPWADRLVRLAANYAIGRRAMSEAETLGASKPTGSIIPRAFEFALPIEPYPYDPLKAKQLMAEAGYPNGVEAGQLHAALPAFPSGRWESGITLRLPGPNPSGGVEEDTPAQPRRTPPLFSRLLDHKTS